MRSRLLLLPALAFALFIPLIARGDPPADTGPRQGDPRDQRVKLLVQQAGELLSRGDRAGAVSRLQQAQYLRADKILDYKLGVAYAEWGKAKEAAAALSRFLAGVAEAQKDQEAPQDRDPIDDARRRLAGYRDQLGRVVVSLDPGSPARTPAVFLDGQFVGPAPLPPDQPGWLLPGNHDLRVSASSCRDYNVAFTLAAGEERPFTAALVGVSLRSPPAEASLVPPTLELQGIRPPPVHREWWQKWWVWTAAAGGVVGVAALIGAGAAGKLNRAPPGTDLTPVDVSR
jgi:hypothetical protein